MALGFSLVFKERERGNRKFSVFEITFDNSYPTGGYPVAISDVGMDARIEALAITDESNFYALKIDNANQKIKVATDGSGGGELTNGSTVLNNKKALLFVWGT